MAEDIAFENERISNFQEFVTLTLTLDWVILLVLHTAWVINHAKCHWNRRNFLWTDGRTFETHFMATL